MGNALLLTLSLKANIISIYISIILEKKLKNVFVSHQIVEDILVPLKPQTSLQMDHELRQNKN